MWIWHLHREKTIGKRFLMIDPEVPMRTGISLPLLIYRLDDTILQASCYWRHLSTVFPRSGVILI